MPTKKKFYSSFLMMSFFPLVIMLCLNTAATLPAVLIGINKALENGDMIDLNNTAAILAFPEAQTALTVGYICYAFAAIAIFFIWYKKTFLKHQIKIDNKTAFSVKRIILAVLLIIGTSSVISLGLYALEALAPSVMESYEELQNSIIDHIKEAGLTVTEVTEE